MCTTLFINSIALYGSSVFECVYVCVVYIRLQHSVINYKLFSMFFRSYGTSERTYGPIVTGFKPMNSSYGVWISWKMNWYLIYLSGFSPFSFPTHFLFSPSISPSITNFPPLCFVRPTYSFLSFCLFIVPFSVQIDTVELSIYASTRKAFCLSQADTHKHTHKQTHSRWTNWKRSVSHPHST